MTIVTCSPTLKDWSDLVIGQSRRWRGLRRNFCRVFSMIPFEALTISSPAVVDVEHVELEHLARRAESFREGRPRPAPVPVNPLLDVGPRFRGHPEFRPVSVDADDLGRQQPSSPCGIRAPMNDPPRRALGDRLADQNRERRFKLCFVHGRGHPQEDAIGLRGAVLLQRDDTGPVAGTSRSTSTIPEALIRPTAASKSIRRLRGSLISTMNGRPRPSIRASTSSRPIPCIAWAVPPDSRMTSAATTSSTLVGYILPVPPHRSQPLPRQRRHGQRVCGTPRESLR